MDFLFGKKHKAVHEEQKQQVVVLMNCKDRLQSMIHHFEAVASELNKNYAASKCWRTTERYRNLKDMIKKTSAVLNDRFLLDVPIQERGEDDQLYVSRLSNSIGESVAETENSASHKKGKITGLLAHASQLADYAEDLEKRTILSKYSDAKLIDDERSLQEEICKLAKRYRKLRCAFVSLSRRYSASKSIPIFPRFQMLKDMIKDTLRECNEKLQF